MIPADALAALPGSGPDAPPPRIVPLAGGPLNRSFRIDTRATSCVLRLNGAASQADALGVDRGFEVAAQSLAAQAGFAPRVVAVAADGSWMLTEFVAGERADAATLAAPRGMLRLGATLARLRELPTPGECTAHGGYPSGRAQPTAWRDGPTLIERARRLVERALLQAGGEEAMALEAALAVAERGWQVAGAGRGRCLVHSDPGPGNVIWAAADGAAMLLDWEYAHLGDPLQDPAAWLQACPALRGQEDALLRACGLEGRADAAMLSGMAAVYAALERAWRGLAATAGGIPPVRRAN